MTSSTLFAADEEPLQFYEIRQYTLLDEDDEQALDDYLANAYCLRSNARTLARGRSGQLARRREQGSSLGSHHTPLSPPAQILSIRQKLASDSEYQQASEKFMARGNDNPAYGRVVTELSVRWTA